MKTIGIRLIDQASWSGAFFLGNIWVAFALSVEEFAASTVATSVGVIVAAVCRAFSLDARLITSARLGQKGQVWFSSRIFGTSTCLFAGGAMLVTLLIFSIAGSLEYWILSVISLLIVGADIPHYGLVLRGYKFRALAAALVYAGGMGLLWASQRFNPISAWITILVAVAIIGWILCGREKSTIQEKQGRSTAIHMSAEALYSALAGQLGILLLYFVAASEATAGIRLVYSLVFAPVFLVIQGLFPLVLRRVTESGAATSDSQKLLSFWVIAASASLAGIAFLAFALSFSQFDIASTLVLTVPFLVPVGLSMVGSLALDAGLLRWRLSAPPEAPHKLRLLLTLVDITLQIVLVLSLSTAGLIFALAVGGSIKLIAGTILATRRINSV